MKSLLYALPLFVVASCNSVDNNKAKTDDGSALDATIDSIHVANTSIDWPGNYKGTVPSADMDSTIMDVTINRDNTFAIKVKKNNSSEIIEDKGSISWEQNQTYIHLKGATVDYSFRLGDDEIIFIDEPGNVSETSTPQDYRLPKQQEYATHDKHQRFPVE